MDLEQQLRDLRVDVCSYKHLTSALNDSLMFTSDISSVTHLRILLLGPIGAGKSAFVNTVQKAVFQSEAVVAPLQDVTAEGTFFIDEYISEGSPFSIIDARGQWCDFDCIEADEIKGILSGHIRPGGRLIRQHDFGVDLPGPLNLPEEVEVPLSDQVHAIVFVFTQNDPCLKSAEDAEDLEENFEPLRRELQQRGYQPICLITKMDEEADHGGCERTAQTKVQLQSLTGSASNSIYCISNYTDPTCNRLCKPETDLVALQVVHAAMQKACEFLKINTHQQVQHWRETIQQKDFHLRLENDEVDIPIQILLLEQQEKYSWPLDQVKELFEKLQNCNLTTARLLRNYFHHPIMAKVEIPPGFQEPIRRMLGLKQ